jgi:hypothetical protein
MERPCTVQRAASGAVRGHHGLEQLHARLVLTGFEVWAAVGASADQTFSEPGFLVWDITLDDAVLIARSFGQFAIYWYSESGARTVVAC